MHVTAIILAGGKGKRMNCGIPKQYIDIDGKPLLYYTIKAFQESCADEIVLVVGDSLFSAAEINESALQTVCGENELAAGGCVSELDYCRSFVAEYELDKVAAYATGGSERYNSVMNGLQCVSADSDIVLVHDGARPCINPTVIEECVNDVRRFGSSVVAVPAKDTIKVVGADGCVVDTPDRSTLWQIQTPQGFLRSELCEAYARLSSNDAVGKNSLDSGSDASLCGLNITDDAMVMECFGSRKVHITMGSYTNIKVTTQEDLEIVKLWL